MSVYKVTRNLVHGVSGEMLEAGVYFTDEGTYDPNGEIVEISTGEAIQNVRQAPPPIRIRHGFMAERGQDVINLLIGYAFDIVDKHHDDYAHLTEHGVFSQPKKKPSKPKPVEVEIGVSVDDEEGNE